MQIFNNAYSGCIHGGSKAKNKVRQVNCYCEIFHPRAACIQNKPDDCSKLGNRGGGLKETNFPTLKAKYCLNKSGGGQYDINQIQKVEMVTYCHQCQMPDLLPQNAFLFFYLTPWLLCENKSLLSILPFHFHIFLHNPSLLRIY